MSSVKDLVLNIIDLTRLQGKIQMEPGLIRSLADGKSVDLRVRIV